MHHGSNCNNDIDFITPQHLIKLKFHKLNMFKNISEPQLKIKLALQLDLQKKGNWGESDKPSRLHVHQDNSLFLPFFYSNEFSEAMHQHYF